MIKRWNPLLNAMFSQCAAQQELLEPPELISGDWRLSSTEIIFLEESIPLRRFLPNEERRNESKVICDSA